MFREGKTIGHKDSLNLMFNEARRKLSVQSVKSGFGKALKSVSPTGQGDGE